MSLCDDGVRGFIGPMYTLASHHSSVCLYGYARVYVNVYVCMYDVHCTYVCM